MSDDSNANGTPSPSPSWTPPPAAPTPPPPAPVPGQPSGPVPDPTGDYAVPPKSAGSVTLTAGLVFGLIALVGVVLALFIKESPGDGGPSQNLWDTLSEAWSLVAIAAAVATLLPSLYSVVSIGERQAWMIGAAGAAILVFWWVLFILPNINRNLSFVATTAVAAGVLAVWSSPANPHRAAADSASAP